MDPVRPAAASLITPPGHQPPFFKARTVQSSSPAALTMLIPLRIYNKRRYWFFFFFPGPVLAMIDGAGERLGPGPVLQLFVAVPHLFRRGRPPVSHFGDRMIKQARRKGFRRRHRMGPELAR